MSAARLSKSKPMSAEKANQHCRREDHQLCITASIQRTASKEPLPALDMSESGQFYCTVCCIIAITYCCEDVEVMA